MAIRTAPRLRREPPRPFFLAALTIVAVTVGLGSTLLFEAVGLGWPMPAQPVHPVPTETADPDPTPIATPIATPSPTPTPAPTPRATPTPAPTPAPTPLPTVAATPTPNTGSAPPTCAYMDVLTRHHGYGDWAISLLDTIYNLPADYAPADLVDSSAVGLNGGYLLRSIVASDLRELAAAARAAGAPIQLVSGYRSHAQQHATFEYWVGVGGYEAALRTSARAGHSEHQLGTAIDVTSEGGVAPWEYADWATTPAGSWMAANAWRYGFVMSYPRASFDRTCYDYEPWHYRYVGRDLATRIAASDRTPREVLWELQ